MVGLLDKMQSERRHKLGVPNKVAHQCISVSPTLSLSDSRVPHYGLRSLAGWRARLTRLGRFPPAGQDGHAVLFAQALIWPAVGFDLLAQAPLPLDHLQQLAIALGGHARCACAAWYAGGGAACAWRGLSLRCQLGQVLELQL